MGPVRVLFDGEAFMRHRRSGISRYFSELLAQYVEDPGLGARPVTPYRVVANHHLAARLPDRFRSVPLPRQARWPVLGRLNARALSQGGDVDVVHHSVHEPEALERWRAPRRVSTIYDFAPEMHPDLFMRTERDIEVKNLFIERSDVLACISESTRADLLRLHPGLDKPVVVTPLAAGEEFSRPRRVHLRGVPEQYVLYVGNRQPHKNVDALFRAFAEVSRELPDLHLVLCGARVSTEPARLRKLGIARRTVTLRPSDAQLPWLYHRARAFVLPSRFEGFGLPVLEAMAAGCPVAIADTPALIEVSDGAAAVFPADDVELLAQTIRDIVGDDALAKDMRERGRRRAEDFSWRRTAQATVRAYDLAREL